MAIGLDLRPKTGSQRATPASVSRTRDAWFNAALIAPGVLLAVVVVAYPLLQSLWNSATRVEEGAGAYQWVLENSVYLDILRQTLFTSVLTVVCCIALGYPYAYLMTIVGERTRSILLLATLIPFWISGLVRIFAWVILLQADGPISRLLPFAGGEGILRTQLAVQIGLVQVLLPFMILPLYNSIRTIDPLLMQAAESMGARRTVAFWRIFVPLSVPGVQAGALVVFILTLGFYVLPQMLGSPATAMIGNVIYTQASTLGNLGRAGALSVLLMVSALLLIALAAGLGRILRGIGGSR